MKMKSTTERLSEAAVGAEELSSRKLALIIDKRSSARKDAAVSLFDPEKFLRILEEHARENAVDPRTGISRFSSPKKFFMEARKYAEAFYGFVYLETPMQDGACDPDTSIINLAAAEKGHGPFMYDLTISSVYPRYVISDRISVSEKASRVWLYYFKNRRGDVEIKPIENPKCKENPIIGDAETKEESRTMYPEIAKALQHKYRLSPRKSPYLGKMLGNGDVFKKRAAHILRNEIRPSEENPNPGKNFEDMVRQRHDSLEDFIEFLVFEVGNHYFSKKYRGGG